LGDEALLSLSESPPYRVTGPRVSIIIPTFQEAKYLPNLLISLKNQTYDPSCMEIIVADYNSTDGTREIASKAGAIVLDVPRGISAGRNRGAAHATADILIFFDADVILAPNLVERLVSALVNSNLVCVCPGNYLYEGSLLDKASAALVAQFKPVWWTSGRCIAVKREAFNAIGGFDENIEPGEDRDFGVRLYRLYPHQMAVLKDVVLGHSFRRARAHGLMPKYDGFPAVRNGVHWTY